MRKCTGNGFTLFFFCKFFCSSVFVLRFASNLNCLQSTVECFAKNKYNPTEQNFFPINLAWPSWDSNNIFVYAILVQLFSAFPHAPLSNRMKYVFFLCTVYSHYDMINLFSCLQLIAPQSGDISYQNIWWAVCVMVCVRRVHNSSLRNMYYYTVGVKISALTMSAGMPCWWCIGSLATNWIDRMVGRWRAYGFAKIGGERKIGEPWIMESTAKGACLVRGDMQNAWTNLVSARWAFDVYIYLFMQADRRMSAVNTHSCTLDVPSITRTNECGSELEAWKPYGDGGWLQPSTYKLVCMHWAVSIQILCLW